MAASEIEKFREFWQARGLPEITIRADCAMFSLLPPGAATHAMECYLVLEKWINERRAK